MRPSDAHVTQHRGNAVGDFGDLGVRGFEAFDGRHESVRTAQLPMFSLLRTKPTDSNDAGGPTVVDLRRRKATYKYFSHSLIDD